METIQTHFRKPGVIAGLLLTLLASAVYGFALFMIERNDDSFFRIVTANLVFAFGYSIFWLIRCFRERNTSRVYLPFVYALWLLSCFSCNLFINIFENLPPWVYLVTALFCLSSWILYWDVASRFLRALAGFVNGVSLWLMLYYAFFLLPYLPHSFFGIIVLGIGLHGFAPGFILLLHGFGLYAVFTEQGRGPAAFISGFCTTGLFIVFFTLAMQHKASEIKRYANAGRFSSGSDLPEWVRVSQQLAPDYFSALILKKDLVYTGSDNFFTFDLSGPFGNTLNYNERKIHDPLLNLAYLFVEEPLSSKDDRIRILEANFGERLQTERRLWSGQNLRTLSLTEDVLIFPGSRLAYTELTLETENLYRRNGEALYAFRLPEGSVASSLSLWVNGIERKAVLASKSEAGAAYDQVVGVERRDPALLQWREGNRIVVRVFPVVEGAPRRFKIGVTTPLRVQGDKVLYQSIGIKGPDLASADAVTRVRVAGEAVPEFSSKHFEREKEGFYRETSGVQAWTLSLDKSVLQPQVFRWEDRGYLLQEARTETRPADYKAVVLDLNAAWTEAEARSWLDTVKDMPLYVLEEGRKKRLHAENFEEVWKAYSAYRYTLPALYALSAGDLLVTRSGDFSPNFDELEGSAFLEQTRNGGRARGLRVLNTGPQLSPYWHTLREQHYAQVMNVSPEEALKLVSTHSYPVYADSGDMIHIQDAQLSLSLADSAEKALPSDNDHIYRLYAYGRVLQEHLGAEADTSEHNRAYVALAEDAHIVSPVSSMLVLETDADYERTGITENENTLGNASMNNHGAVPEPHEWALIILSAAGLLYYIRKRRKNYAL
ncbi:MAG: XrtN system VIT domain-containing protein [Bacteroidia bacterium]|nr:XrtN system VIT domain-containing protein [Bacteroidia bacterium]